ncbi:uncharacterized protein LOC107857722 [Capsicum annuum]|uniref:uncharacterized protein LOC107857722 n=1 Tax=Capsicum annuum TaxID=4072 RepID=UPI001FB10EFA|nr:uncharacterized protein LOC107857722 [Capsicum annuum]
MIENSNQTKEDIDENDIEENINQVAKAADLSPKQIEAMKKKQVGMRKKKKSGISLLVTLVYAKYNANERVVLWDSLTDLLDSYQVPWLIGGDFNVIRSEEEKIGGLPVTFNEIHDFNQWINLRNVEEIHFKGSKFTWWNGRTDEDCIFKRFDRVWCNDRMQHMFQQMEVEHLVRSGSDHSPMLIQCKTNNEQIVKSFKFLNFWLKEEACLEKITTLEDIIKVREKQLEEDPSGLNRPNFFKAHAELNMQLKREEDYWIQKAGNEWFKDGEKKTNFFHTIVKERRSRLRISKIQNEDGQWLEEVPDIAEATVNFFQK